MLLSNKHDTLNLRFFIQFMQKKFSNVGKFLNDMLYKTYQEEDCHKLSEHTIAVLTKVISEHLPFIDGDFIINYKKGSEFYSNKYDHHFDKLFQYVHKGMYDSLKFESMEKCVESWFKDKKFQEIIENFPKTRAYQSVINISHIPYNKSQFTQKEEENSPQSSPLSFISEKSKQSYDILK